MKLYSLIALCLLIGCKTKIKHHPIQFYHWKTKATLDETEQDYFKQLDSEKLYIRLFDLVKKNSVIEPTAIIQNFESKKLNAEYIPTVFIVNEVFQGISDTEIKKLVQNIYGLIQNISNENNFSNFKEIQIDCDWTQTTKDAYFKFLKELKSISQLSIGSTLRLHQVKFRQNTGIPPADKVYLMCYATSSPIDETEKNSILDLTLLKDYLKDIDKYPLKMDVALPIYSWAVVTNHLGKKKLINAVSEADLTSGNYKKLSTGLYEITEDSFLKGIYLNKGFTIKLETIPSNLLKEVRSFLDTKIKSDFDIVYYHLDTQFLTRYSLADLK